MPEQTHRTVMNVLPLPDTTLWPSWQRISLIVGTALACMLLMAALSPVLKDHSAVIVVLPVIALSWLFGTSGGLLSAGLCILGHLILVAASGEMRDLHFIAPDYLIATLVAIVTGQLRTVSLTAERELAQRKQNELRYKALYDETNDGVFIISLDGQHIAANRRASEMLGYSEQEILMLRTRDVVVDREYSNSEQVRQSLLSGYKATVYERAFRCKDGSEIEVEINASLVRSPDGSPLHIQSIVRDITERKRADEELRQERNLLRTLIDNLPDYIFVKDAEARFVLSNRAHNRAAHINGQDILGKSAFDLFPPENARHFHADDMAVIQTAQPLVNAERETTDADGKPMWVLTTKVPLFDHKGRVSSLIGISRDITQRKAADAELRRSQDLYRTLARNMPDTLVVLFDRDLRCLLVEGTGLKYLNLTNDMLEGKILTEVLDTELVSGVIQYFEGALQGREQQLDYRIGDRCFELNFLPVRDDQGMIFAGMAVSHDVTERKQNEDKVRRSEILYRSVITVMTEGVVVQTADGVITACNSSAERILGLTTEQLIGRTSIDPRWQTIHEDGSPFPAEDHPTTITLKTGQPQQNIIMGVHKPSGDLAWISISSQPVFNNGDPFPYMVVATFTDITQRRLVEERLRESEERFRRMADSAPVMIWLNDENGIATYLNQFWVDFTGLRREDGLNGGWLQAVHPEDREEVLRNNEYVFENRLGFTNEYRVRRHDGQYRWVLHNSAPRFTETGSFAGYIGSGMDITERKQAEAELKDNVSKLGALRRVDGELNDTLNVSYVLAVALDAAVRLSSADCGFIALVETTTPELVMRIVEGIGYKDDALREEIIQPGFGIVGRVMSKRTAELVTDVRFDPDYYPHVAATRAQISLPLVSQENIIGLLNLETRYSERFTTESFEFLKLLAARIAVAVDNARLYQVTKTQLEELQILYERVSALEQLKTDMIRIAAHDLRNPINIVMGYLDALRGEIWDDLAPIHRDFIEHAQKAARRMRTITTDILSLQRLEFAQQEGLMPVDIHALACEVTHEYQALAAAENKTFTADLTHTTVAIVGDKGQLREAMVNIISNAFKYTHVGDSITIRLQANPTHICFDVDDTGMGVPEDMQSRLFQPFYRARTQENMHIDGTGLGLHLVKNIIERHKGIMHFNSVYGQGSTFGFELPLMAGQTPTTVNTAIGDSLVQ